MPLEEFWHGDIRLLKAYQTAYYRKTSYEAWSYGDRFNEVLCKALYNSFGRQKKSDKAEEYSSWVDPIEKLKKRTYNGDIEETFRKQQAEQNAWLFSK